MSLSQEVNNAFQDLLHGVDNHGTRNALVHVWSVLTDLAGGLEGADEAKAAQQLAEQQALASQIADLQARLSAAQSSSAAQTTQPPTQTP